MKLHELLQVSRKAQKLTLMQLVNKTTLSYSMVHRILSGSHKKPNPHALKQLSEALKVDYQLLLEKTGYVKGEHPSETDESKHSEIPILSWDYCLLTFPFQDPITSTLSNQKIQSSTPIPNGFALVTNKNQQCPPYYLPNQTLICNPDLSPNQNHRVLYIDSEQKNIQFGIYKKNTKGDYILPLHQGLKPLYLDDVEESPVMAVIQTVLYSVS